jgi:hypothetical protein
MIMSMHATRKLTLATVAGVVAMMGAMAPALAKGGHHHHRYVRVWTGPAVVTTGGGCSYYYWKWQNTGSRFWKAKYFNCIY